MKMKTLIISDLEIDLKKYRIVENGLKKEIMLPCFNYDNIRYTYYKWNLYYNCYDFHDDIDSYSNCIIDLTIIYNAKEFDIKKVCENMLK